jgi:hypothetical protein
MNTWLSFVKYFYKNEKTAYGKCANSGTLKRAAKIYQCQKKMDKKTVGNKDTFKMKNPMHKKTRKNKKN